MAQLPHSLPSPSPRVVMAASVCTLTAPLRPGVTRKEVAEALGVAIALNAGAALAYSARVLDAYAAIDGAAKSATE
jgi:hypothetical protein